MTNILSLKPKFLIDRIVYQRRESNDCFSVDFVYSKLKDPIIISALEYELLVSMDGSQTLLSFLKRFIQQTEIEIARAYNDMIDLFKLLGEVNAIDIQSRNFFLGIYINESCSTKFINADFLLQSEKKIFFSKIRINVEKGNNAFTSKLDKALQNNQFNIYLIEINDTYIGLIILEYNSYLELYDFILIKMLDKYENLFKFGEIDIFRLTSHKPVLIREDFLMYINQYNCTKIDLNNFENTLLLEYKKVNK